MFALAWRWVVRAATGYVLLIALLAVSFALFQPALDWSRVGGLDSLIVSYAFWVVVMVPVLALAGIAEAVAVWLALRMSAGSTTAGAITAGISGALIVMAFTLIYSEPRAVDLVGYGLGSVVAGAIAAWLTVGDTSRISSVANWVERLRREEVFAP
ncbi:hypothetical protein [Pengzhenrongella phosphoraccumulans]|uniref:hypothetical protein n=1 Tax=Pengzhenrongella phosphoraccumulans TaxID=3114394 RepID=UPI00388F8141